MVRHKQVWVTFVLLVGVVFTVGVLVGSAWQSQSATEVAKILRSSELDAESFLVEQELFETFETNCNFSRSRLDSVSGELWKLGKLLSAPNARERLGESDYDFLKRKYHLMQIRTFVLEKSLSQECGDSSNVVLFYFSRSDPDSKKQGEILDELVNRFDIHVFAVEYNYSRELKFLEEYYNIRQTPTLVVNFSTVLEGLQEEDALVPMFDG